METAVFTFFSTATFDFVGFDNATAVTFQCSLDGGPFTPCATPMTYTGLSLGEHTFAVRARDWSGNVDPSPASYTWTIEALPPGVPPETTLVSGPDVATTSTSATFVFTANEPGVTYECSLDGAPFTSCASPQSYFGLAPGAHSFAVYAIDSENLPDTTPATHNWFITTTPVPAAASCGQVITQSTLLTDDLLDCLGDGLIIGAHGITLDLNGRSIDGVGLGIGIRNDGFDNVVITNGTITSFDYGVQLNPGTENNVVSLLNLLENQDGGVQLLGVTNVTVRNNNLTGNKLGVELSAGTTAVWIYNNFLLDNPGDAVYLFEVSGNRIEANQATGSSGAGVNLEGSSNNVVIGNTFIESSKGGVNLLLGSNNNRVEGNTILDSGSSAISLSESDGNQVISNTAHNNGGGGIALELADNNTIARNDVRFNSGGIELISSSGNRIEANFASGVGGSGIEVEADSYNNEIVANTVIGNSGEGIYIANVAPAGQGNLIADNLVSSNSGDGISVNGSGHTIANNTADLNGGWGIYASVGGMDGGGNRALGNDEPTQCFNVVCEIGTWYGQPDTIIVMKPTNPTNSSTAIFTFTGVDDTDDPWNLDFECRLDPDDDSPWIECENPWFYTNLSDGWHTFEVRAIDSQGNIDPTPATYTWLYTALPLGVPPDTFLDRVPPLESPFFEGFFSFYSNEPDVTFECSLDGSPFAPCGFDSPEVPVSTGVFIFEFEEFEVGQHTFAVRAIDIEGLVDPTPATYTWNIAGLIVSITDGPAYIAPEEPGEPAMGGETEETFATFHFVSNLPDTIFYCSLDLEPFEECLPGVTYTDLAIGEHIFRVYGEDLEGRVQLEPTVYEWEIIPGLDVTPPDTFITGGPDDPTGSVTFTFTGLDDVTSPAALLFECSLNDPTDAGFSECTSPWTYPNPNFPEPLAVGWHTFYVRAMDAEDNVDPSPAFLEFEYFGDTIAPVTTILTGPPPETPVENVFFTFEADDPYPTFECSLNGEPFTECQSPHEEQISEPGEYTLEVRAIDLAGNVGAPDSWTWVFLGPPPPDTEAPETSVVVGPADPSASSTATFVFTGSDNETLPFELEFQCRLDSSDPNAWADCESPFTYTGLGLGAHLFEVRAVDLAGNVDETPASHAWTIVLPSGPESQTGALTNIDAAPDPATLSTNATFAFSANDPGASLECSLDGASFSACASPITYTSLTVGEHVFSVRAGASDPQPSVYVWTIVPQPVPTAVTCGQVLNHSAQLLNSLSNCPSGGLYIGAANIAVDLNGQTVDGLNYITSGQSSGLPAGITNIGFANVVIYGGTVQEFGYGILHMAGTTGNTIHSATLRTNSIAGAVLADTTHSLIRNSVFTGNEEGIWLLNADHNLLRDNALDGNLGMAVILENSHSNRIANNTVNGTTYNPLLGSDGGIVLEGSGQNVISGNVIHNTGDGGILLIEFSNNNRVEGNQMSFAGDAGIVIEDSEANLILGNVSHYSADAGIGLNHAYLNIIRDNDFRFNPFGIELEDSNGNLIEGNNASNNTATGIWIGGTSLQNQVVGNTANNNAANGISDEAPALDALGNPAPGNLYDGNTANNNTAHGIFVAEPGHTLQNNTANNNGQWGILAAAGTINGGSNTATGNGFAAQCLGIACNVPTTTNTPVGSGVTVPLTTASASAEVTFSSVSVAGNTTLTVESSPPTLPDGYLQVGALFYDISTTATFSGPVVVCLDYTPGSLPEPVQLLHFEGGAWVDVTVSSAAGQVCGQVSSLSPFAIAALAPPAPTTPPVTTIHTAPANPSTANMAAFTFSADKPSSTFQCSLDGAPFTACTSPVSYSNLSLGAHEFRVRAIDAEGNVEPTPVSHIWTILAPVDCGPPVVFAISIDAWIDQGSAGSNKGTDSILKLQAKTPNNNMRALVRFNLPISLPPGCQIQTATLRMFAASAINGRSLQALRLTGPWTEYGVTWNNQPGTAGTAAVTNSGQGWREWDVAALVQEMMVSGNHGFLIRDANETGNGFEQQFHAREKNENVPQLIITYAAGGSGGQDITPPQTSIEAGPELTTMDTSASFAFSADEQVVGFECSLNGASFTGCDSPAIYNNLAVADHTFAVRAIDLSGLIDPTPATFYWTVEPTPDTTPPQTTIDTHPAAFTISGSATFTFSADEAGSTFECSLDGADWTACASPRELSGLAVGGHTFQVRATDAAGNTDATPASYAWTIVTPPDTTIDTALEATTTATDASFAFSANVSGTTFECALDGASFTACVSPMSYTGLGLGAHTFAARAIDPHGHADPTPATYTWTIVAPPDTTAPETTINSGPASPTTDTNAQFTFSANEPATFECSLDGAAWAECVSPVTLTNLNRGGHTFAVRAIDLAGNVDPTPANFAWTIDEPPPVDITPPESFINTGPADNTEETSAVFTFSANEEATFECSLNGSPFTSCFSPIAYSGLLPGPQTFSVRATDLAGNTDPEPPVYDWTIAEPADNTPPETTIISGPTASSAETTATFTFAADEAGSSFECSLDGAPFIACAAPVNYTGLSVGDHTFAVRAIDQAGNVDPTPANFAWTVLPPPDTTPPQTTITNGPNATTTSTSVSFTFTADEPGVTFECALDGSAFVPCAAPREYHLLSAGSHTFAVRGTDPAGNVGLPVTYTWTVAPPPNCGPQVVAAVTADAWIDQGSASSNKGRDSILKVQGKSGNNMRALLRFALPTNVPEGCVVDTATLRLFAASWRNGRTIQVFQLNGPWTETGVTWNNQPPTVGTAVSTASGSGWREWNVSAMVQTMLTTGINHGFLVRDASESGGGAEQQFHAREKGNNIPVLVITFKPGE